MPLTRLFKLLLEPQQSSSVIVELVSRSWDSGTTEMEVAFKDERGVRCRHVGRRGRRVSDREGATGV